MGNAGPQADTTGHRGGSGPAHPGHAQREAPGRRPPAEHPGQFVRPHRDRGAQRQVRHGLAHPGLLELAAVEAITAASAGPDGTVPPVGDSRPVQPGGTTPPTAPTQADRWGRSGVGTARRQSSVGSLEGANLLGLRAPGALADRELDPLGSCEAGGTRQPGWRGKSAGRSGLAVVRCDEAIALVSVEPLNGSLCHSQSLLLRSSGPLVCPRAAATACLEGLAPGRSFGARCQIRRHRDTDNELRRQPRLFNTMPCTDAA